MGTALFFGRAGKSVNLSFQGVESGFACWLNGQYLGYSEDSFTPSDFCLDSALRQGVNRLAVRVFKWTPGSWFEDQDFFRFSGIYRSVFLYAQPETALLDLHVQPELSEDYTRGTVTLTVKTRGEGSLRLSLRREGQELAASETPLTGEETRVSSPERGVSRELSSRPSRRRERHRRPSPRVFTETATVPRVKSSLSSGCTCRSSRAVSGWA